MIKAELEFTIAVTENERDRAENMNVLDSIRELRSRELFVPFLIALTRGDKHLIESPNNLVEMRTEFFYATPGGESFVFPRKNRIAAVERPEPRRVPRRKAS